MMDTSIKVLITCFIIGTANKFLLENFEFEHAIHVVLSLILLACFLVGIPAALAWVWG